MRNPSWKFYGNEQDASRQDQVHKKEILIEAENGGSRVTRHSPLTGKLNSRVLPVSVETLVRWLDNEDRPHIQIAFPDMDENDREFLISGYTPEDFDFLTGSPEEEYSNYTLN